MGSGVAQIHTSRFASVRVVEMGERLAPDPLRGIGSVMSDMHVGFESFRNADFSCQPVARARGWTSTVETLREVVSGFPC